MYDHRKVEKEVLEFWEKNEIYKKSKAKNAGKETFYFCDGPPYATGQIHPGTGWNKTLKDAVCRYHRVSGKDVRVQAGYDTHGLPIEVKVEQELKFKHKGDIEKYGIGKFVDHCKEFATRYIGVMGNQFKSLGVWMDFDTPYITYKDSFIDSSWKNLQLAHERGLLHEGVYVLPYCYRCETTMANYELEYDDQTDPSIYVKFKLKDKENEHLIVWTTTPWTLVSNMAVMVHPTYQYVRAKVGDEIWVIAKDRLEHVMGLINESATVIEELPGRKLKDLEYIHPFQDKIHKHADRIVVLSDEYVTLEEGTGLVHTAPGHGPADFIIGKRFGIEAFSPVDEKGKFTDDAGDLHGKNVREANPLVIEILKDKNVLVYETKIKHRYPHCWRCKTPLIFLTTNQWFITISKIKDQMLNEVDKTEWYPAFAKDRFREFVSNAPDWCISRQRYWGIPLPIWKCECGKIRVIGSMKEIPKIKELHRPYIDEITLECECGKKMERIPDVLDVWFDSGNAIWASLTPEEAKTYSERADLIIEGQDQIRGWFYSLLGSGVVRYGACPYKKLLMHGFFVDEKGEKMSKSLGNFVPLEDILDKYGADSFRLWGISNTIWDELKFSWDEMKKATSDLNIVLNMIVFLERFYPKKKIAKAELTKLDEWMISRLNSTIKEFRSSFECYELNRASKTLRSFIVDDISRFYMKIAKDRISNEENAEGALWTLYHVMLESLKMLGCFSPMISEHLYQTFYKKFENEESLYLLTLSAEDTGKINPLYEKQMETVKEIISNALLARQTAAIKVRWPIGTLYIETKSHEVNDTVTAFGDIISSLINVKELKAVESKPTGDLASQDFSKGTVHIDKKLDEALYEEGLLNEVKRRVQMMRKEAKLVESDKITLTVDTDKEIEAIVKKYKKEISEAVNASAVEYKVEAKMNEYTIDGRLVKLAIKKD
ncbi:Isoleucine--tRNA ligase [Candidatus Bilamarchaeum dharawalense]|uniref:Isoleucine--tRNA ligase n=1 Tax=Candidatus Bilamarchaeum dharawalense TaxID=2885759 RepID=A0A5E4LVU4_9ARCH|nr:Isoleucine--tRNA ligase [Candidatus Bilamarchaeum dharawalense]